MTNSRAKSNAVIVYKLVDETVNNSVTMQNDNELFVSVGANNTYLMKLTLIWSSGATPDIKLAITIPSGAVAIVDSGTLGAAALSLTVDWETPRIIGSAAGINMLEFQGRIIMSTTAGTVTLQWAQGTQDVSDTKILIGSKLELLRIK